jgi:hypothetical protein
MKARGGRPAGRLAAFTLVKKGCTALPGEVVGLLEGGCRGRPLCAVPSPGRRAACWYGGGGGGDGGGGTNNDVQLGEAVVEAVRAAVVEEGNGRTSSRPLSCTKVVQVSSLHGGTNLGQKCWVIAPPKQITYYYYNYFNGARIKGKPRGQSRRT